MTNFVRPPNFLEVRGGAARGSMAEMSTSAAVALPWLLPEDLQPLANCGHDVLVFHNGFNVTHPKKKTPWKPVVRPPVPCKDDGW